MVFGAEFEATSEVDSIEVVTKTCEITMQALLPAMLEKLSAFFVNKFKESELGGGRPPGSRGIWGATPPRSQGGA